MNDDLLSNILSFYCIEEVLPLLSDKVLRVACNLRYPQLKLTERKEHEHCLIYDLNFIQACKNGIEKIAKISFPDDEDKYVEGLFQACENDRVNILQLFSDNLLCIDDLLVTCLKCESIQCTEFLLSKKPDLREVLSSCISGERVNLSTVEKVLNMMKEKKMTPKYDFLEAACFSKDKKLFDLYLYYGSPLEKYIDKCLRYCVEKNRIEMMDHILSKGVKVKFPSRLFHSVYDPQMASYLLSKGFKPNLKDRKLSKYITKLMEE